MSYEDWFQALLDQDLPVEGGSIMLNGREIVMRGGLLRDSAVDDAGQQQTSDAFGYKWSRTDTYESEAVHQATRNWLIERYGDLSKIEHWAGSQRPLVLDAGCGSGLTARLLLGPALEAINYVGVDISSAVDVASDTFRRENRRGAFIQADLCHLPFADGSFDFILSEGVLHHTPSTRESLLRVAAKLKPGGKIAFYVYAKKSPIREFTDDYIRSLVAGMDPAAVWETLIPLSKLGQSLGELNVTVDVPEDVPLLGIKKGPINIQRLFYWHICKMYYRPEYNLDEMNHVNYDWFTPTYSFRQTPEEVSIWCAEAGLRVLSQRVEEAGITTLAVRL